MALKNIPDSGYSDDDGSASPELAAALAAYAEDRAAEAAVLAALHTARLLVPVVAVLGETETGPDGLRREKTSDMAVPTIQAPDGRRALPAFTSTAALARWRPEARPVAVPLRQALQALAHEGADTLLIDLAGPVTYELTGPELRAASLGPGRRDPLEDPAVREALRAATAAEPGVVRAHLIAGQPGSDGTLGLVLAPDADVTATGGRIAAALAADEVLRGALVQGLDLALLPPDAAVAAEPFFTR
ncbi:MULTISPECIES: SseB family protein [unclassified Streptomyces]|uniref:SseB family protein n=1 Tax=unclassified Streptomyces TaxID=2593676 RepID=UPI002E2CFD27|nr:SseB family protein [Streptomyces sp. NBC_00223]